MSDADRTGSRRFMRHSGGIGPSRFIVVKNLRSPDRTIR
jgi:hypothetical protein